MTPEQKSLYISRWLDLYTSLCIARKEKREMDVVALKEQITDLRNEIINVTGDDPGIGW